MKFEVAFPKVEPGRLDQHDEWCEVTQGANKVRLRFHDYAQIFSIPGLYEALFYDRLACTSPATLSTLLTAQLQEATAPLSAMRVLDVGAGNGMVGEALKAAGVSRVMGADLLPEAKAACERDRPGVYEDYLVGDLTALSPEQSERVRAFRPNVLTTVAALGFGDIPPEAFAAAWNLLETPAWVAFNIKDAFLSDQYPFGFSLLIRRLIDSGLLEARVQHRYVHRLSVAGDPLHYVAIVGRKTGPIPEGWLQALHPPA